ncbi:unnamed protein product [Plutella xylostella]|uniref:(diamondback moth) hypothetical protein n=1 Tax=Plutella xylostella TaxID=51655 RepID=A0A8S4DAV7_PLUXY|nr:unnamed protein product [Plutella xylostella]
MVRYLDEALEMSEAEFRENYRLSKTLFEDLCGDIGPLMKQPTRVTDISIRYKILVALSFYATGSYQRLVGNSHGTLMSQQSVSRAISEVTCALNNPTVVGKWIKFPQNEVEREILKRRFYEKYGIPAIIGCIDGTHVAIIRPQNFEERYFNRKHYHSRNVMIICDADLNILCVDASFGGASHDSHVWNQHPVKEHLINLQRTGERVALLGDSGYAQREYMMTPIVDAPAGSPEEYYTQKHCTARNTVERAIGVIKARWRCLLGHRVLHYHPDKAASIIHACVVLHNMCNQAHLDLDQAHDELQGELAPAQDIGELHGGPAGGPGNEELHRGEAARAQLVRQLWASR